MTTRAFLTDQSPSTVPALEASIATIEAHLARIVEGLALARNGGANDVADKTALAAELACVAAETSRLADRVSSLPIALTPLPLLSLESEQLTLINGIDIAAARLLNDNGLHRFADIAALMPEDVKELSRQLGAPRRIAREGWIEQAALLAQGIDTAHAARIRAGDFASVVALAVQPAPKVTTADTKPIEAPAAPAQAAEVIELASKRERTRGPTLRAGGMAIAAAFVLALTLSAGNIAGMAWGTNSKSACGSAGGTLSAGGKCTLAQLP
jgi:predicted flap endonuclease-1-like 5' DNA nuclease